MELRAYIRCYRYAALWALLILVLSGLPARHFENKQVNYIDVFVHFLFYLVFSLLLVFANIRAIQAFRYRGNPLWIGLAIAVLYGFLVEVLQGMVFATRSFEWLDALANAAGGAFGIALFYLIFGNPQKYVVWKKSTSSVSPTNAATRNDSSSG